MDICIAVHLQKCPLGEFPLSFILNKTKSPKRSATDFMTRGPFSMKTSHMQPETNFIRLPTTRVLESYKYKTESSLVSPK